jgi:signal transduction histidine kinase
MLKRLSGYLAWIGPYPYNPGLIFIFFAATYFTRFVPAIGQQTAGVERWMAGLIILALACIPALLFAILAILFQKYRPWPSNLFTYVVEVALGQALLLLLFPLITLVLREQLGLEFNAPISLTPSLFLASLVLVLGILAVMHLGERSIRNRLAAADKLVAKLELDREGLVKADVELREQTSRFLHDRVQSDLMVAAMKLKRVAGKSTPEVNEVIDLVISRLEKTRTSELRDLVQTLAPHFEAAGFRESARVLATEYLESMDIEISVDDASEELSHDVLLGVFRIIEQSLLNALVHGPAKHVKVALTTDASGRSHLEISDDGPGAAPGQASTGVGTAVIDSWLSILKGVKTIETAQGHGYRLTVSFTS